MFGASNGEEQRPYFIPIELEVAAGATGNTSPAEDIGGRDFVWTALGVQADQPFKIKIRDAGGNVEFQKSAFHVETLVGTNNYRVFPLPVPWRFTARSSIYVEVENLGSATDTIYITFIGYLD